MANQKPKSNSPASKTPDPTERKLESLLAAIPEGAEIDHYMRRAHTLELFVNWQEPGRNERLCPNCGSTRCVKKDAGKMQTIRHVRCGEFGTLLTFHKPRFLCKDCGKSFYVKPKWVFSNMSISTALMIEILSKLTSTTHSVKQISKDTHTSVTILHNVMYRIKLDKPKSLPQTLGIDEFHGKTGTYNPMTGKFDTEKYHCVLTNPDQGCVLDVLYKATFRELHSYFMEYPQPVREKVKFFCTDMRSGFSKTARCCFPNARICIDPFHVIKLLSEAVDAARKDAWHRFTQKARNLKALADEASASGEEALASQKTREWNQAKDDALFIQSSRLLLLTSPSNQDAYWNRHEERRDQKRKDLYSLAPDLETAREALEEFHSLVEMVTDSCRTQALTDWLSKYTACSIPSIRQAAFSIRKRRKDIENAWKYKKSNGATEGLNKKIKDIRRMGFGAHDFQNLRRRILLACGAATLDTVPYTIFDEKNSQPGEDAFPLYEPRE